LFLREFTLSLSCVWAEALAVEQAAFLYLAVVVL
jgi:hypothetical protein